jgi:hypothetical protein
MSNNLKKIHRLLDDGNIVESQDVLRKMLSNQSRNNGVLTQVCLLKAYEINTSSSRPFEGLTSKVIEAHSLIVRQLLIDNSEELDRRLSRVL